MFEDLRLRGRTRRAIVLQTRAGTGIVNDITLDPGPKQVEEFTSLVSRFPQWEVRKAPTGGYNCAGHVWAARRTGIFDDLDNQSLRILQDDGYRTLEPGEEPRLGDLALYWETLDPRSNLYHVGMVFEFRRALILREPEQSSLHPWVLSKMGAFYGEVLHHFNHVFFFKDAKYAIEYWTDRPLDSRTTR